MPNYIICIILITEIRPKNEFNNVPQRSCLNHKKYLFDRRFFHGRRVGGGVVDEHYVTLEGVYRPALRSVTRGWGCVKFSGKKRYVTLLTAPIRPSAATRCRSFTFPSNAMAMVPPPPPPHFLTQIDALARLTLCHAHSTLSPSGSAILPRAWPWQHWHCLALSRYTIQSLPEKNTNFMCYSFSFARAIVI